MIFQAGNVRESLFNLKEKKIGMKGVRIGSGSLVLRRTSIPREPLDHYGFFGWWGNNLTTYSINLNPKKNLTSF